MDDSFELQLVTTTPVGLTTSYILDTLCVFNLLYNQYNTYGIHTYI